VITFLHLFTVSHTLMYRKASLYLRLLPDLRKHCWKTSTHYNANISKEDTITALSHSNATSPNDANVKLDLIENQGEETGRFED